MPAVKRVHADFRAVADHKEAHKANARNRAIPLDKEIDELVGLHAVFRKTATQIGSLRAAQKQLTQQLGQLRRRQAAAAGDEADPAGAEVEAEARALTDQSRGLKVEIAMAEAGQRGVEQQLWGLARLLPNRTHPEAPVGPEKNAVTVDTRGPRREFEGFSPRDHVAIANSLGLVNFQAGARVSGRAFCYLKGHAALLELALVNFAVSKMTAKGFTPVLAPDVVREQVVLDCGFQPRGEETQVYKLHGRHSDGAGDLCLVGTAEIPLAAMHQDELIPAAQLPLKYVAFGHCFRAEAGGPGAESRGLYRVHQFSKVELYTITENDSDTSGEMLASLLACQIEICDELGLHYRVLDMPTEELGAPAYRKFDLEAWMPGRGVSGDFGEICSASDCTDYQSRRLNIRYKPKTKGTAFVHTQNATALAVPRVMVALLENGQQPDGTVVLPDCLAPWLPTLHLTPPPETPV